MKITKQLCYTYRFQQKRSLFSNIFDCKHEKQLLDLYTNYQDKFVERTYAAACRKLPQITKSSSFKKQNLSSFLGGLQKMHVSYLSPQQCLSILYFWRKMDFPSLPDFVENQRKQIVIHCEEKLTYLSFNELVTLYDQIMRFDERIPTQSLREKINNRLLEIQPTQFSDKVDSIFHMSLLLKTLIVDNRYGPLLESVLKISKQIAIFNDMSRLKELAHSLWRILCHKKLEKQCSQVFAECLNSWVQLQQGKKISENNKAAIKIFHQKIAKQAITEKDLQKFRNMLGG